MCGRPRRRNARKIERRPRCHLADHAGHQRSRRHHQRRIGREIRRDLDTIAARTHANAGRFAVGREEHDRRRQHVGQQSRQRIPPRDVPRRPSTVAQGVLSGVDGCGAIAQRRINRHVVVRAEPGETRAPAGARLPGVELAADEANRFPQRAPRARDAAPLELDERRGDLDDARVEIHGRAGWKLVRGADAMQQIAANERARRAEHRLGPLWRIIYIQRQLGLEADRRQTQSRRGI
jgi:hypothetical protein